MANLMDTLGAISVLTGASANPLITCRRCPELAYKVDDLKDDLKKCRKELADSRAEAAALKIKCDRLAAKADDLEDKLRSPKDPMLKMLKRKLAESEDRATDLDGRLQEALLEPPFKAPLPRGPRAPVPLRVDNFHRTIIKLGFTEVVFFKYAGMVDMGQSAQAAWVVDGRVSNRFYLMCMQVLMTTQEYRKRFFTPPTDSAEDHGPYFFWLNEAAGLTADLVLLINAYDKSQLTSKTHVTKYQLQANETHYQKLRVKYHQEMAAFEHEPRPDRKEYLKTIDAGLAAPTRTNMAAREEVVDAVRKATETGGALEDFSGEGRHVFISRDASLAYSNALANKKKRLGVDK